MAKKGTKFNRYSIETKREAVRLHLEEGLSYSQVAHFLVSRRDTHPGLPSSPCDMGSCRQAEASADNRSHCESGLIWCGQRVELKEVFCMESPTCNAVSFLQFLEFVLEENCDKHVVMVLDNAKIHRTKLLQPFLKENENRLTLFFFPPYSPNLSLLERIWKWLKEDVIANQLHATQAEIRTSVLSFLENFSLFPEKSLKRIAVVKMLED
jgi:transposase